MLELPRAGGRVFNMAMPLVDRHVREGRGDLIALRQADDETPYTRDVSYAQLLTLVNRAGNELRAVGVRPEERVALVLPDCVEFVAAFIGAMKIGAVPVPLNPEAYPAQLEWMLEDCRPRHVISDRHYLRAALETASVALEAYPTGVDQPCYWLYTSGTTGDPKGVVHLHGDMLACVVPFIEHVLQLEPADVLLSVSRLFFSYGLANSLFMPLLAGASAVLSARRPDALHTLVNLSRFRPSVLFSVPSSYAQLLEWADDHQHHAFASLRLAISGGEALPEGIYWRWLARTGVELLDGMGSTELGYNCCSNLPGQVRPGTSGRMLPEHAARIVDPQGRDVPDGTVGELWVKAASTALYYWNQRERSKQTFQGEWLRTGDQYIRDADGFLWHQGRVGDVFKVNGQWLSPVEVEQCLSQHPDVVECAIVAWQDQQGLTKPKAYVVRRGGGAGADELQTFVRERLESYKYPRAIEFVDALPRTTNGKIQRRLLADQVAV